MGIQVLQNVVVCPHCDQAFVHNKINGIALVQLASDIEAQKRMHLRLMLNALEILNRKQELTLENVRKVVLDGNNDLVRGIHVLIGFGLDVE